MLFNIDSFVFAQSFLSLLVFAQSFMSWRSPTQLIMSMMASNIVIHVLDRLWHSHWCHWQCPTNSCPWCPPILSINQSFMLSDTFLSFLVSGLMMLFYTVIHGPKGLQHSRSCHWRFPARFSVESLIVFKTVICVPGGFLHSHRCPWWSPTMSYKTLMVLDTYQCPAATEQNVQLYCLYHMAIFLGVWTTDVPPSLLWNSSESEEDTLIQ